MMETRSHDQAKHHKEAEKTEVTDTDTSATGINIAEILKDAAPVPLYKPEPPAWRDFEDDYYDRKFKKPSRPSWVEFEDPYPVRNSRSGRISSDQSSTDHG